MFPFSIKKKTLFFILLAVAVVVVVGGIGKFHPSPFSNSYTPKSPSCAVTLPSGQTAAMADHSGMLLLLMDDDGRLAHTVTINNADHSHDRIVNLNVLGDSVFADVITFADQQITRERILQFNQRGRLVRSLSDFSYDSSSVYNHQNQIFFFRGDSLFVARVVDSSLVVFRPGSDTAILVDSASAPVPLLYASMDEQSGNIYLSSLYGQIFQYGFGSSSLVPTQVSDSIYESLTNYHPSPDDPIAYAPLYRVKIIFYWLSLLMLVAASLYGLYKGFRHFNIKSLSSIIVTFLLLIGVVGFYTYHVYKQAKSQVEHTMAYQMDLLSFVLENNYMDLVQDLSQGQPDSLLALPQVTRRLSQLHTILAKSSQFADDQYYVTILYNPDSIPRNLADNMNTTSVGDHAYIAYQDWDAPSTIGIDTLYAIDFCSYFSSRNIVDSTGRVVVKIFSVFPDQMLKDRQFKNACSLLLSLLSILVGFYALFIFAGSIRHSLAEYRRRLRLSLPYAKEHLYPSFYALIVWFKEVDRTIMVFIIPCFTLSGDIGEIASTTASVLMAYSIGTLAMIPFTKMALSRFSSRTVGIAASVVTAASYLLMVVAIQTTSVPLFCVAKFISGASVGNVMAVISHTLGASVKDKDARAALFNDKQTVGNTVNILTILISGYIIQYLNPVVLYAVAIFLSLMLIGVCSITLSPLSPKGLQSPSSSNVPWWKASVASFKFFTLRDGISTVCFVLLPSALIFGYHDFIYPLYASECGISPLLLSNIMVVGLALNLLFRNRLNAYYNAIGSRRALMFQTFLVSGCLLLLAISPNIIWMTIVCLVIFVFKMNASIGIYQAEVIDRNGFLQQEVQADLLMADYTLKTARVPLLNFLVQMSRTSAGAWVGAICLLLTAAFSASGKDRTPPPSSKP